ncbi:unnamed protein product, partial [Tetraodon nigroviridis]
QIAETYAFLPREAVTRFLMSCGECQKRMHINPSAAEFKENDRPTSLVPDLIDYNMPLTATYLKQMKLQCRTSTERVRRVRVRAGPTRVLTAHPIRASPQMRPALHRNSISVDSRSDYWLLGGSWPQGERVTFDLVLETEGSPLIVWEEELRGGLGNVLFGGVTSRTRPLPTAVGRSWDYLDPDWDPRDDSSVSSEDMNNGEPAWVPAEQPPAPDPSPHNGVANPAAAVKEEEDDSSSESSGANRLPALTSPEALVAAGNPPDGGGPYVEAAENGLSAPLDFSTTSPSSSSEDQQMVHLSERLLPAGSSPPASYPLDANRKYPAKADYSSKSPPYSSGSYDSVKTDVGMSAEDLTSGRAQIIDEDDDEHDEHDDSDKINDAEGMDPERLKAFNMFVRLFVDENLDRMVPISKQPKEKIQAIIESCSRQFPEFQERSRKRIRTYLKSCRRMKKGGFEVETCHTGAAFDPLTLTVCLLGRYDPHLLTSPPPSPRTSWPPPVTANPGMLPRECDWTPTRPRMSRRLRTSPTRGSPSPWQRRASPSPGQRLPRTSSTPTEASTTACGGTQRSPPATRAPALRRPTVSGSGHVSPSDTRVPACCVLAQLPSAGPTDLSMKSIGPNSSSTNSHGQGGGGGGGGASAQLSPPDVTAVRQLIAGYRESAAFLLRSADELENLILQQN